MTSGTNRAPSDRSAAQPRGVAPYDSRGRRVARAVASEVSHGSFFRPSVPARPSAAASSSLQPLPAAVDHGDSGDFSHLRSGNRYMPRSAGIRGSPESAESQELSHAATCRSGEQRQATGHHLQKCDRTYHRPGTNKACAGGTCQHTCEAPVLTCVDRPLHRQRRAAGQELPR
jgi:hypothetical protein